MAKTVVSSGRAAVDDHLATARESSLESSALTSNAPLFDGSRLMMTAPGRLDDAGDFYCTDLNSRGRTTAEELRQPGHTLLSGPGPSVTSSQFSLPLASSRRLKNRIRCCFAASLLAFPLFFLVPRAQDFGAAAQLLRLDGMPTPPPNSMLLVYRLFAYTFNDPPALSSAARIPFGLAPFSLSSRLLGILESRAAFSGTVIEQTGAVLLRIMQANDFTIGTGTITPTAGTEVSGSLSRPAWTKNFPLYSTGERVSELESLLVEPESVRNAGAVTSGEGIPKHKLISRILFDSLRLFNTSTTPLPAAGTEQPANEIGLHLIVVSFQYFLDYVLPRLNNPFAGGCCTAGEVNLDPTVCPSTMTFPKPRHSEGKLAVVPIPVQHDSSEDGALVDMRRRFSIFRPSHTDSYLVFLANCFSEDVTAQVDGNSSSNNNATLFRARGLARADEISMLKGQLVLHNYYGFLPGVEAPKAPFYLILLIAYVALMLSWVVVCVRYRAQLIHVHLAIGGILLVVLIEATVWLLFYRHWNRHLEPSLHFRAAAILSSIMRSILSFVLLIVVSLGWGITRASLSITVKRRIGLLILAYVAFDAIRQVMTQVRMANMMPVMVVLFCIFPVSLLNAVTFCWIFSSLNSTIEELQVGKQSEKLSLFLRLRMVLVVALILALLIAFIQVFVIVNGPEDRWRAEWIFVDAVPHVFAGAILVAIMVLWAPHRDSKRVVYSVQLPRDEDVELPTAAVRANGVARRATLDVSPSQEVLNQHHPLTHPVEVDASISAQHSPYRQNSHTSTSPYDQTGDIAGYSLEMRTTTQYRP